jgi:hypothetical protein
MDICSSPHYYIKKIEDSQSECDSGWEAYLIDMPAHEVAPHESISGVLEYHIWNSSQCPSCPHQLIIGINNDAKQCIFDGIPHVCPGKTEGTSPFSFSAPSSPGTYYINVSHAQESSCEDAMRNHAQSNKSILLEISVVDPCTIDSDNDGIYDCNDKCPHEKGTTDDGCPSGISSEICNNGIDDDQDGKIDCDDPDCRNSSSCTGESDLSLESVAISPSTVENGSYATITLKIKNVGNTLFPGGHLYIQLDFMDIKGSIGGERIIYQLFYKEKVDNLEPGHSDTIVLEDVHIQDHAIIEKTVVIDTLHVTMRPSNKADNSLNNQRRTPISVIPSTSDIVNCTLMWIKTYFHSQGVKFNYDINTMTTLDRIHVFVDFTKSLTIDYPEVSEHLNRDNWKDGGVAFALFALEMFKFYEIIYSQIDPVTFAISCLNTYVKGVMGCANILTWGIQFIIGFISEINLHDIHITAFWCESPVDITVLDEWGRKTGVTVEGEAINDIPGSTASLIEDKKLVILPTGSCTVEITGRDEGTFDLTIVRGENDSSTDVVVYEDVPVSSNSQAVINIEPSPDYTMNLDRDGDGIFEENIHPPVEEKDEESSKDIILYFILILSVTVVIVLIYYYNRK